MQASLLSHSLLLAQGGLKETNKLREGSGLISLVRASSNIGILCTLPIPYKCEEVVALRRAVCLTRGPTLQVRIMGQGDVPIFRFTVAGRIVRVPPVAPGRKRHP